MINFSWIKLRTSFGATLLAGNAAIVVATCYIGTASFRNWKQMAWILLPRLSNGIHLDDAADALSTFMGCLIQLDF
jgi:hypothetical protein